MELKGRREVFAREYLKDLHGTNAAIRAGYSRDSARTQAAQMLALEDVQDRVAELAAARNKKFEIEAVDVLLELYRMLTADVALAFNEDGRLHSIHDIPIDLRRTIAGFENEELFEWQESADGGGREKVHTGTLRKVKFWSKEKAAEMLGRHLALFKDVLKIDGLDELAKRMDEARGRTPIV